MTVDTAAYAQVIRDATEDGAELDRFREPMGDDRYVHLAEPIALTAQDPGALAAAAEDHPGFHASDGYVTVAPQGEMLATYDLEEGSVSIDGDILYSAVQDRSDGILGTLSSLIQGERNPIYRRARDRARDQDIADHDEWTTRNRRASYGLLGMTAAALVTGGYGLLAGEPQFFDIGAGIAASELGVMGTYGAYASGGVAEMMDKATSRRADAIDERAGDTVVHVETSGVIDAWLDAVDPDAETPHWMM